MPALAAAAFSIVVAVVLVVAASTSGAAFGPHNPGWQGLSEVHTAADDAGLETVTATDPTDYDAVQPNGTLVLLVAPEATTAAERDRLRTLAEGGGTVAVASRDPTVANPLFETLGTEVRVDGEGLRDEREHVPTPDFPLVTSVADHPYVRGAEGMALNHGTALTTSSAQDRAGTSQSTDAADATVPTADAATWHADDGPRPLANSSAFSYLDRDGDGEPGSEELLDARPVVAREPVGSGEVVAVSDPSAFINVMLERSANRAFVAGVLGEHDRLVLDRTDGDVPPLVGLLASVRNSPLLGALAALGLVGGVLAWERRPLRQLRARWQAWRGSADSPTDEHRRDRAAMARYVAERYPDLDERQRERVLGGVMNVEPERRYDDGGD